MHDESHANDMTSTHRTHFFLKYLHIYTHLLFVWELPAAPDSQMPNNAASFIYTRNIIINIILFLRGPLFENGKKCARALVRNEARETEQDVRWQ